MKASNSGSPSVSAAVGLSAIASQISVTVLARLRITEKELQSDGKTSTEIFSHCKSDCGETCSGFYLLSRVWPVGFPWASHVAQGTLLPTVSRAGSEESQTLSSDAVLPLRLNSFYALATGLPTIP